MSIRSLNGLSSNTRSLNGVEGIGIETIIGGDAIAVSTTTGSRTIDLDISKQNANTTIADADLFVLEDASGNIRKITGQHLKSGSDTTYTASPPLLLTGTDFSTTFTPSSITDMSNKTFTDATTFKEGLIVKQSATSGGVGNNAGFLKMYDADSSNFVYLLAPTNLAGDFDILLPSPTTTETLVGNLTPATLSNKTITSFTGNSASSITTPSTTGTLAITDEIFWEKALGAIRPKTTTDKLQLFSSIRNDSNAQSSFLDLLTFKNTTPSSALATFKYQLNDASVNTTSNAKFKMVHYDDNTDTTTDIYSVDTSSILTFSKRLTLTNGLKQGSYNYTMPSATGTICLLESLSATAPIVYNSSTGAFTFSNSTTNYITKSDLSASAPIVYNSSTGGFSFSNSTTNYITLSNLSATAPIVYNSSTGAFTFNNSSTNYITLSSLSASSPLSYNSSTGAFSTTFTPTSTTDMSNKTFTNVTVFNQGLYTGYDLSRTTSGFVRFYEGLDYGFGSIDLHIEGHQVGGNWNVFLPNSVNNTILVGKNTTDVLTNKTLSSSTNTITNFTGNSSATITTPNSTGTLALFSQIPTNNNMLVNGAGYITSSSLPTAIWNRTAFIGGADIEPVVSTDGLIVPSVKTTTIIGTVNPTQTKIVENTTYGWEIDGAYSEYCLKLGSNVYLGDDAGSFQLHINAIGDAYKVGADLYHIFYGNRLTCANNSFRVSYVSTPRTFITDPSGTDNSVDIYGSYIGYHNNGTELRFNTPNSSYQESNSQGITFSMAGYPRQVMYGSTNPAVSYFDTDGTTVYANVGLSNTFPANVGQWSSISNPMGEIAYYIAGANTNDSEGYFFAANGEGHYISNTGDDNALTWYDEDYAPSAVGWTISTGGSISSISDERFKTDIQTYKNSNFEKYQQIRTITYKKKKPPILPQKRLEKQKCIDKYDNLNYGVIAQELYSVYPELETTEQLLKFKKWKYKRDNWNNGVYEQDYAEWKKKKEEYEKCNKDCDKGCKFNDKEPTKEFSIEEPHKVVDYQRLNILTIGVVQDLIKQNEELKNEMAELKALVNKLLSTK